MDYVTMMMGLGMVAVMTEEAKDWKRRKRWKGSCNILGATPCHFWFGIAWCDKVVMMQTNSRDGGGTNTVVMVLPVSSVSKVQ